MGKSRVNVLVDRDLKFDEYIFSRAEEQVKNQVHTLITKFMNRLLHRGGISRRFLVNLGLVITLLFGCSVKDRLILREIIFMKKH